MPRSDVITVAELLGRNPGSTPHAPVGPRTLPRPVRKQPWLTRTNKTSAAITFGSVLAVGTTLAVGSTLLPHTRHADPGTTPTTGPVSDSSSITPHEPVPEHNAPASSGLTDTSGPAGPSTLTGPAAQVPGSTEGDARGSATPPVHHPAQGHSRNDPSARSAHPGTAGVPAARVPTQGSATVPGQGRHAASTPRGPHLDQRGTPAPSSGSASSGRHRDTVPQSPSPGRDSGPSASGPSNSGRSGPDRGDRDDSRHSRTGPDRNDSGHSGGGLLGGTLGDTLGGLSIGPL